MAIIYNCKGRNKALQKSVNRKKEVSVKVMIKSKSHSYALTHFFFTSLLGRFYYNLHFTSGENKELAQSSSAGFESR